MILAFADPIGQELCRPQPAKLIVFADRGSFGHVMFGALAGIVPPPFNLATCALFGGYQVSKLQSGTSPARLGGKFVEFGLGLAAMGLIAA
jgi:hypothetical protein